MIVSVWFVPTAFVSVTGSMSIFALTQCLVALPLPPAAVLSGVPVLRVNVAPETGITPVADTVDVPVAEDVILTVQLALAPPPV